MVVGRTLTFELPKIGTMRNHLATLLIIASALANAQTLERVEVVTFDSTRTTKAIYRAAERWFVDAFPEPQMFSMRDSTLLAIVARRTLIIPSPYSDMPFTYTMEVEVRQGRYKVRVYDVWFTDLLATNEPCCLPKCTGHGKTMEDAMIASCRIMRETPDALITSLKGAVAVRPEGGW